MMLQLVSLCYGNECHNEIDKKIKTALYDIVVMSVRHGNTRFKVLFLHL